MSNLSPAGRAKVLEDGLHIAMEATCDAQDMTVAEAMTAIVCFTAQMIVSATNTPEELAQGLAAFKAALDDEAYRLARETGR
jgi:hypothetical protein